MATPMNVEEPWMREAAEQIIKHIGARKGVAAADLVPVIATAYAGRGGDLSAPFGAPPDLQPWMVTAAGVIDVRFEMPRFDLAIEWAASIIAKCYKSRPDSGSGRS